jgi:anti-sigma factor RsiW
MRCHEVRERLVAWDDGELSPGEATQVDDHVRTCPACAAHGNALHGVTPRPSALHVPAHILAALHQRVDVDVVLAEVARQRDPDPVVVRLQRFLRQEAQVPMVAVVAYAAVLLLAVSLAVSGWWSSAPALTVADQPSTLPSEQYEPASFRPATPQVEVDEDGFR